MRKLLRWSYGASADASTRRDMRLDLLRGFCVLVMVADHIGGERSWVYIVTGGKCAIRILFTASIVLARLWP